MNRACAVLLAVVLATVAPTTWAQPHDVPQPPASASSEPAAPPAASAALSANPSASTSGEDSAATAFLSRCSGCHTLGGGNLQGPDLLPATQWQDAQLRSAVKLMEKRVGPISNESLDDFVALLRDPAVRDRIGAARTAATQKTASNLERPSPALGSALFHGPRALANGGLPCATCHHVDGQGGTLGPDLSDLASKMSGPALVSAVHNASFNVMRAAYRDHPITQQEAIHLAAWFESRKGAAAVASSTRVPLFGFVLGTFAFVAVVMSLRPRSGARDRLLRHAMRK